MWLRTVQDGFGGRWKNLPKHVDILQCDHCMLEYKLKHRKVNQTPSTFCSRKCLAQSPTMLERKRQTCLNKHGVEFVSQIDSVKHRKYVTKKRNGTYGKSLVEDRLHQVLVDRYTHVVRQSLVNKRAIDFYLPNLNVWVQLDGVYWHGLRKEYDQLTEREKRWFDKDREQDRWFASNKMKLVRITDKTFNTLCKSGDFSLLERQLTS